MRTMNDLFTDADEHKERVNQLDLIGKFLQANVKHIVFVKLDSRCG